MDVVVEEVHAGYTEQNEIKANYKCDGMDKNDPKAVVRHTHLQ